MLRFFVFFPAALQLTRLQKLLLDPLVKIFKLISYLVSLVADV